jgi:hypothetical protein
MEITDDELELLVDAILRNLRLVFEERLHGVFRTIPIEKRLDVLRRQLGTIERVRELIVELEERRLAKR